MKPLTYLAVACLLIQMAAFNGILHHIAWEGLTLNLPVIELKQPIRVDYTQVAGVLGDALSPPPTGKKGGR